MKHPRLPNGMGTIRYLGKGRSNPYAVYAPDYRVTPKGNATYTKRLCYVPDWYTGFAVLVSYKAGTYHPGDEIDIARQMKNEPEHEMSALAKKILSDYRQIGRKEEARNRENKHTFLDTFNEYFEERFGEYATQRYSDGTKTVYKGSVSAWSEIHEEFIEDITRSRLQGIVNALSEVYKAPTIKRFMAVASNVFTYAMKKEYITANPMKFVGIPMKAEEVTHAEAYTEEDLKKLGQAASKGNQEAMNILIQCYSGFRISAFEDLEVKDGVFYGGVKTGKRYVPIHSAIKGMVEKRGPYVGVIKNANERIRALCKELGIEGYKTTHSARHTFKSLCDRYGVSDIAQRLLMGHSISSLDVHDSVYTHFSIEDLRKEIEKIPKVF